MTPLLSKYVADKAGEPLKYITNIKILCRNLGQILKDDRLCFITGQVSTFQPPVLYPRGGGSLICRHPWQVPGYPFHGGFLTYPLNRSIPLEANRHKFIILPVLNTDSKLKFHLLHLYVNARVS